MSGVTELDAAGEKFIAGWEGGQASDGLYHAYWDAYGHIETIGCGQTEIDGRPVPPSLVWTPAQAYADLDHSFAERYAPSINALKVELNHNQFNATGSAIWNLGTGSLEWDWGRALKAGNFREAANLLLQYDRSGGVTLQGLVDRRRGESALLLTPEPKPPNPYGVYPTEVVHFKNKTYRERNLAQVIDNDLEHPHVHHHSLAHLLPVAEDAKLRVWVLSVFEGPEFKVRRKTPDWDDHRGVRYQLWAKRIARMEKALA